MHSRQNAVDVLAPKVLGTMVLDAVFQDDPLDFLILFSSVNVIFSVGGTTDYTAANCFLDQYAIAHHSPTRRVIAINWDTWRGVGMIADSIRAGIRPSFTIDHAIEPAEGIAALRRIFTTPVPQIAVITRNFPELTVQIRRMEAEANAAIIPSDAGPTLSQHARPASAGTFVDAENEYERFIATTWQELLGLDQVGVDDNFFELGGHSLIATSMLARVQQEYQVKLPLRTIFEASTVRELAERVSALAWASQPAASASAAGESREEFEI
jgi:acyl carrier protein